MKNKLKLLKGTLTIPIDCLFLEISVITSEKEYNFLIEKNSVESDEKWEDIYGQVFYINKGKQRFIVCVLNNLNRSTIAHETVHIVDQILQLCNIPIIFENSEIRAYLTGFIFDKIYRYCYE